MLQNGHDTVFVLEKTFGLIFLLGEPSVPLARRLYSIRIGVVVGE